MFTGSTALGLLTRAEKHGSFAAGFRSRANDIGSVAMGREACAGVGCVADREPFMPRLLPGKLTNSRSVESNDDGYFDLASSVSVGSNTNASAPGAVALGHGAVAAANGSFAFGAGAVATGMNAVAMPGAEASEPSSLAVAGIVFAAGFNLTGVDGELNSVAALVARVETLTARVFALENAPMVVNDGPILDLCATHV